MAAWLGVAVLVLGLTHWRNVGLSVVVLDSKKNSKDLEGFEFWILHRIVKIVTDLKDLGQLTAFPVVIFQMPRSYRLVEGISVPAALCLTSHHLWMWRRLPVFAGSVAICCENVATNCNRHWASSPLSHDPMLTNDSSGFLFQHGHATLNTQDMGMWQKYFASL